MLTLWKLRYYKKNMESPIRTPENTIHRTWIDRFDLLVFNTNTILVTLLIFLRPIYTDGNWYEVLKGLNFIAAFTSLCLLTWFSLGSDLSNQKRYSYSILFFISFMAMLILAKFTNHV